MSTAPPERTDPLRDFDFLFGSWRVQHRRLKERLAASREWIAFEGTCTAQPLLGGVANVDDHWLDLPGDPYRAVSLRAFNPNGGTWGIWWLDSRYPPALGAPVVGRFESGVGAFYADATLRDRPVKVRLLWSDLAQILPVGAGAFTRRRRELGNELGDATCASALKARVTRTTAQSPDLAFDSFAAAPKMPLAMSDVSWSLRFW